MWLLGLLDQEKLDNLEEEQRDESLLTLSEFSEHIKEDINP